MVDVTGLKKYLLLATIYLTIYNMNFKKKGVTFSFIDHSMW